MSMKAARVLVLLAAIVGCSGRVFAADAKADIAKAWSEFKKGWLTGNVPAATAAFFTPDATNVVPGAAEARGRAAIDASFKDFFASSKVLTFEQTTEEFESAGGLAYEHGTFEQTVQQGQASPQASKGRYLAVWKRLGDGSWKCHRFLFNYGPT